MADKYIYRTINYFIAAVWIVNGLFCKILHLVPRHQQIVATILGNEYAVLFTRLIGFAEVGIAIWFLCGIQRRLNVIAQIMLVAAMNTLEYFLAPNLLLWGRWNALYAFLFIIILFLNEFYLHKNVVQPS